MKNQKKKIVSTRLKQKGKNIQTSVRNQSWRQLLPVPWTDGGGAGEGFGEARPSVWRGGPAPCPAEIPSRMTQGLRTRQSWANREGWSTDSITMSCRSCCADVPWPLCSFSCHGLYLGRLPDLPFLHKAVEDLTQIIGIPEGKNSIH